MSPSESSKEDSSPSRCPVQHGEATSDGSVSWWSNLFSQSTAPDATACTSTPSSLEEAARHAQTPQPDQKLALRTDRQVSSIPRGSADDPSAETPTHQAATTSAPHWVYPSEQQLYNAMRKKGWKNVPEDAIPSVLQIHNTVNEQTWRHVQAFYDPSASLQLARFSGRPRAVSPTVALGCHILGWWAPPFDRHDWYVAQSGSSNADDTSPPRRFVIEYYEQPGRLVPYIDARPALDDPGAVYLRLRRWVQLALPGITRYMQERKLLQQQRQEHDKGLESIPPSKEKE